MIYFNTSRLVVYNKIIHLYLEVEIFGDPDLDLGDRIEDFVPTEFKYLFREQYTRYVEVFKELYEWTQDKFIHEMKAFHEMALYYFLMGMEELKNDMGKDFIKIFYTSELRKEIHQYAKKDKEEYKEDFGDTLTIKEFEEWYYSPYDISGSIYEDIDFVSIATLYNEQKADVPFIAKNMGINLDYYFELLPLDIQKQYSSNHITLTGEISELFSYLQQRITNGSLSELFWEDGKPVKEKKIHTILENLMDAYFIGKGIDISREVLIKNGLVDFKLYRSNKKY